MPSIREKVVEIVYDVCGPDLPDLSDSGKPLLDSGLDSLDFASVLMALEDHFKIQVGDDDLDQLRSIDDMVLYVERRTHA